MPTRSSRSQAAFRFLWIGLTLCLLGVLGLISGGVTAAQEGTPTVVAATVQGTLTTSPTANATLEATPEATKPVLPCAECHLEVVVSWQDSAHAMAYTNSVFQAAYLSANDPACLGCHTTGFNPRTGDYTQMGVACEACHGVTPADHPPQALVVETGVDTCADCHLTTLAEWKVSGHGSQQLACTTCHNPHPQSLRFENAQALCLNCHQELPQNYAHTSHTEQACVDCHWYKGGDLSAHVKTGNLFPTGHDNVVETATCLDCHTTLAAQQPTESRTDSTGSAGGTGATTTTGSEATSTSHTLDDRLRAEELAARLRTLEAQSQNAALLRTLEGLILGAALSGGVFLVTMWVGRRLKRA